MAENIYTPTISTSARLEVKHLLQHKKIMKILMACLIMSSFSHPSSPSLEGFSLKNKHGGIVIAKSGTIVNQYINILQAPYQGERWLLANSCIPQVDDLVLIIGEGNQHPDNDGPFEFARIDSLDGNRIRLDRALAHNYVPHGRCQIVIVPEYHSLRIKSGASIQAQSWNGETGGVIAIVADSLLTVQKNGSISSSGLGPMESGGRIFILSPNIEGQGIIQSSGKRHVQTPLDLSQAEAVTEGRAGCIRVWGEKMQGLHLISEGVGNGKIYLPKGALVACYGSGKEIFGLID